MDESSAIAQPFIEIYENYYRELNPGGAPTISAGEAANFLRRSGLPVQTLGQVWEIADFQKRGVLDKRGTFMAFKLVAAAQQGHPVHVSSLQVPGLNPPNFGGVRTGTPLSHHSPSHQTPPQWGISPADQNKYDSIFDSLVPENGKLSGNKVRPVLLNSGLNPQYLAKIWELSDQDKDGQLDRIEMAVALHLVYRALQNDPIPSQLPTSLIHSTKAHLSRRQSTVDSYQQNGTLRSRAGSMASLDGINQSSIVGYGDRSVSVQLYQHRTSLTSTPSHNVATPSDEWPVDKLCCAAQFSACDTDFDGLVNGVDVRPVLMSTGLPQQYLAHIWELADINKTGVLNQEQFALIIHLVNMRMRGEDLPMQLPGHLMPPSLRQLNLNGGGPVVEVESTVTADTLAQAAQSDNPEVRKLVEEMEKLMEERKEADTQITQLESDMTAKNSAIRNFQIELQTLQGTVKQLERQKAEAQRRLGDLDEQIRQLEAAGVAQSAKGAEATERLAQLKTDSEEGAASAERDQVTISSVNAEMAQLEAEARSLQASLATEQRDFEAAVDEMTRSERELERGTRNIAQLVKETEAVQAAMIELQQINSAEDVGEKIKEKMHLLSISEKPQLLSDSDFVTPSTSTQSDFHQPPDPFSGQQNRAAPDSFANVDPFKGASGFSSAFPNDPFTSSAFPNNGPTGKNKPPPPRPVPPKATSNRATPVAEDPFANTDPFAGQTAPAAEGAGFADFANFGSFN